MNSESGFQVDAGLLGEDMAAVAGEVVLNGVAVGQSVDLSSGHVHGGNDHDDVAAHGGDVQVDSGARPALTNCE